MPTRSPQRSSVDGCTSIGAQIAFAPVQERRRLLISLPWVRAVGRAETPDRHVLTADTGRYPAIADDRRAA